MIERSASVILALGYAATVLALIAAGGWGSCWAAPLGRMAFTNYLLQSLIFGWIFYGYGLGLFGSGLPPLQRWESGFMPFKSCSAGGGSGAFASVRWNAVAHPHVRDHPL